MICFFWSWLAQDEAHHKLAKAFVYAVHITDVMRRNDSSSYVTFRLMVKFDSEKKCLHSFTPRSHCWSCRNHFEVLLNSIAEKRENQTQIHVIGIVYLRQTKPKKKRAVAMRFAHTKS